MSSTVGSRLSDAMEDFDRAWDQLDRARDERNRAIREAVAAGWTHRQVADVTRLTDRRVAQIIKRADD